jgi:hypothetical protein
LPPGRSQDEVWQPPELLAAPGTISFVTVDTPPAISPPLTIFGPRQQDRVEEKPSSEKKVVVEAEKTPKKKKKKKILSLEQRQKVAAEKISKKNKEAEEISDATTALQTLTPSLGTPILVEMKYSPPQAPHPAGNPPTAYQFGKKAEGRK